MGTMSIRLAGATGEVNLFGQERYLILGRGLKAIDSIP